MKWIEHLDFGSFRTQGIVAVGVTILTCTVSCRAEDYRPMDSVGFIAAPDSSSPCACYRASFVASFWRVW